MSQAFFKCIPRHRVVIHHIFDQAISFPVIRFTVKYLKDNLSGLG